MVEIVGSRALPLGALLALLRAGPAGSIMATPEAPYRCHACWRSFPEAQLTVVDEAIGRGFRCPACLVEE
jgi:DNA-directed RNA polymerase subunit RPC12/RpoP